jgi:hypothetical protein
MTDFSAYLAGEITDWMSQNTQLDTPPTALWVTVFDTGDNELSGSLTGARASVSTSGGWTKNGTNFENASQVSLGEASQQLTDVEDVALFDAETGGNLIARYTINEAPFNVADGSELTFEAGELSFDVVDRTE